VNLIQIALVVMGFLVAGIVKGATGLGYSTSALPVLTIAVGLHTAMPLVLFPSMASNLTVMAGLAFGLALMLWIDQDVAASVLGLVIIAYCGIAIWRPALHLPDGLERPLQIPVGLLNGAVNGLTGSQIMPLVPFMLSLKLHPDRFVQAVNIGFTLSSLVMVLGLSRAGLLTWNTLLVSVGGIAPAMLGSWFGGILRRRLSEAKFRLLVLAVLMVLGAVLVSPLFSR
jgi:uncharacterized protein